MCTQPTLILNRLLMLMIFIPVSRYKELAVTETTFNTNLRLKHLEPVKYAEVATEQKHFSVVILKHTKLPQYPQVTLVP